MKHPPKITCDICEIVKGETNHWFMWHSITVGIQQRISFLTWSEEELQQQQYGSKGHVCGQDCAAKLLMRELSK
jgi:hypothetical protein